MAYGCISIFTILTYTVTWVLIVPQGVAYELRICKEFDSNRALCTSVNCSAVLPMTSSNGSDITEESYFCEKFKDECTDSQCKVVIYLTVQEYQVKQTTLKDSSSDSYNDGEYIKRIHSQVVAAVTLSCLAVSACVVITVCLLKVKLRSSDDQTPPPIKRRPQKPLATHNAPVRSVDAQNGHVNAAYVADSYYEPIETPSSEHGNNNTGEADVAVKVKGVAQEMKGVAGEVKGAAIYEEVTVMGKKFSVKRRHPAGRSTRKKKIPTPPPSSSSESDGEAGADNSKTREETPSKAFNRILQKSTKKQSEP